MKKKFLTVVVVLVAVSVGAGAYYARRATPEPAVRTAQVTRGDIVDVVSATGTLEAVTTVEVGTQVGGVIEELYADFNSIVKKGQVIARLDPTLLQTNIEQQRANVIRSQADLDRLKVALADAKQKLERAKTLFDKSLLPRTELETAEVNVRSAEAQIRSSEAGLTQARSQLNSAEVNLTTRPSKRPLTASSSRARRAGPDRQRGDVGADALRARRGPDADAGQRQHRRVRCRAHASRASREFQVDAYPNETFTGAVCRCACSPRSCRTW